MLHMFFTQYLLIYCSKNITYIYIYSIFNNHKHYYPHFTREETEAWATHSQYFDQWEMLPSQNTWETPWLGCWPDITLVEIKAVNVGTVPLFSIELAFKSLSFSPFQPLPSFIKYYNPSNAQATSVFYVSSRCSQTK